MGAERFSEGVRQGKKHSSSDKRILKRWYQKFFARYRAQANIVVDLRSNVQPDLYGASHRSQLDLCKDLYEKLIEKLIKESENIACPYGTTTSSSRWLHRGRSGVLFVSLEKYADGAGGKLSLDQLVDLSIEHDGVPVVLEVKLGRL
ncbi:MAG: hypothetical protein JO202_20145 [Ktedonobacteraceae bacterium]|nr:hypothetical protein [Ktedonobacteraceae bacterium]